MRKACETSVAGKKGQGARVLVGGGTSPEPEEEEHEQRAGRCKQQRSWRQYEVGRESVGQLAAAHLPGRQCVFEASV